MIYDGIFENRNKQLIEVFFFTKDAAVNYNIFTNDATEDNGIEVYDKKQFRVLKGIFTTYSTLNDCYLSKVRVYKGMTVTINGTGDYCITSTDTKRVITAGTASATVSITKDGYLWLNVAGDHINLLFERLRRKELIFSREPVTITQNSNGFFSPLKLQSATVRLMTELIYTDLYAANYNDIKVKISTGNRELFSGYVTPCIYSQNYNTPYEELEIECVSKISTLDYETWELPNTASLSIGEVVDLSLLKCGFTTDTKIYVHDVVGVVQGFSWSDIVKINTVSLEGTYKEVLENILKPFAVSLIEYDGDIYILDNKSKFTEENRYYVRNIGLLSTILSQLGERVYAGKGKEVKILGDSHNISFDDVFGSISVIVRHNKADNNIFNFDDDNLVCIHPNLPYIEYTMEADSTLNNFYFKEDETKITHKDLYRFYRFKDMNHYRYLSKWDSTYGFNAGEIDESVFTSNSESVVKDSIEGMLNNYACCYVVKHLRWNEDAEGIAVYLTLPNGFPTGYNWETFLLFSYGINNEISAAGDAYNSIKTTKYTNHLQSVINTPIIALEKKLVYSTTFSDSFNTFWHYDGEVTFLKKTLTLECNKFTGDSVRKYDNYASIKNLMLSLYINDNYISNCLYDLALLWGLDIHIIGDYIYDNIHTKFVYTPMEVRRYNTSFKNNIINSKGYYEKVYTSFNGTLKIGYPVPMLSANNTAPSYAIIKDAYLGIDKDYPIEVAVDGKVPDEDKEYTYTTDKNEVAEVEIKYGTQTNDKPISYNSLLRGNVYLGNVFYKGDLRILEEVLLEKYKEHYSTPKLIYLLEVDGANSDLTTNPTNLINTTIFSKDMAVDSYDYNLCDDIITLKLIEQ